MALRLVCEREGEIEAFQTQKHWSVEADLLMPKGSNLEVRTWGQLKRTGSCAECLDAVLAVRLLSSSLCALLLPRWVGWLPASRLQPCTRNS